MSSIREKQIKLESGQGILTYDNETIEYAQTPIGKAIYKKARGRPKLIQEEKKHWSDRIMCDVCGVEFIRSARSKHKKTKVHQAYSNMNDKIKDLLLGKK